MKPILTTILVLSALCGFGQSKPIEFRTEIMASDTSSEIFSFRMTSDKKRLTPIDTVYYTIGNVLNMEVKYRYMVADRPYYLIARSERDKNRWLLFSVNFGLFKHEDK